MDIAGSRTETRWVVAWTTLNKGLATQWFISQKSAEEAAATTYDGLITKVQIQVPDAPASDEHIAAAARAYINSVSGALLGGLNMYPSFCELRDLVNRGKS